jgi:hypothetical protein
MMSVALEYGPRTSSPIVMALRQVTPTLNLHSLRTVVSVGSPRPYLFGVYLNF